MDNTNIRYQDTQMFKILSFPLLFVFIFLVLSYHYQWGDNPIPLLATVLTSSVLFIVWLLFYKLTITIDDKSITASFGIGVIKKALQIENINISSIEKIKTPWYYGIGLRITPHGILYNTKTGFAIKLTSSKNAKSVLIGTSEYEKIKTILTELKQ